MQVTKVKIYKINKSNILGFADVEFDGVFTSKGWRIFGNNEEIDLGLPSEQDKTGRKDEKTGHTKWWPTIWVDFKTNEGKQLMDHIREKVTDEFFANNSSSSSKINPNKIAQVEDFAGDDEVPF